jgi:glycosyltransferase involved in cell wall biosynthesis
MITYLRHDGEGCGGATRGRILYLVGQLSLGGLERQLCLLLEGINREHYRPMVVVWDFREDDPYVARIKALGVPVQGFPTGTSRLSKMIEFCKIARHSRTEIIHSYTFHTNFAAYWASVCTGAIAIGSVRSDIITDMNECGPVLGRLSARWPRHQIFNSFASLQNARASGKRFLPSQAVVARNGVDLQRFRVTPLPQNGNICIAGVGSLLPLKRWDRVLRAAVALRQRGFRFVIKIAGTGPLRASLQQQAHELGIADCVKFVGRADDIAALFSRSAFLVHVSDLEGCPNAVIEAMACGRAVVATDAGDIPFIVDDCKTGFVVRRGDDSMLVERMVTLITDNDLCRSMGKAGRVKAEREFGLDRLVAETFAAYQAAGWNDHAECATHALTS